MSDVANAALGRPREFDAEDALLAAMNVFWEHGFRGATYPRLEAATGLHRQSLVYAFGEKRILFQKALDLYAERRVGRVVEILRDTGPGWNRILRAFDAWRDDATRHVPRGCLFVNAAAELGGLDPAVSARLSSARRRLVRAFESAIADAQSEGSIRPVLNPKALARHAVAVGDGIMLHARVGAAPKFATAILRSFLAAVRARPR